MSKLNEESVDLNRRNVLSRLGLAATIAYAAPILLTLSQDAHAGKGDGNNGRGKGPSGNGASGNSGPGNQGNDSDNGNAGGNSGGGNGGGSGGGEGSDGGSGGGEGSDRDDWDCNYTVNKRSDRCAK